jgi:phage terminase small subunit
MGNRNSGRRPAPTKLKLLRGVGKHRINTQEPQPPPVGEVAAPATLSAAAREVWARTAPVCLAMGTLTVADVTPFGTWCELQARFEQACRQKNERRMIVLADKLRHYYALFGLEPVSRSRIHVRKTAEEPVSKWVGALP